MGYIQSLGRVDGREGRKVAIGFKLKATAGCSVIAEVHAEVNSASAKRCRLHLYQPSARLRHDAPTTEDDPTDDEGVTRLGSSDTYMEPLLRL